MATSCATIDAYYSGDGCRPVDVPGVTLEVRRRRLERPSAKPTSDGLKVLRGARGVRPGFEPAGYHVAIRLDGKGYALSERGPAPEGIEVAWALDDEHGHRLRHFEPRAVPLDFGKRDELTVTVEPGELRLPPGRYVALLRLDDEIVRSTPLTVPERDRHHDTTRTRGGRARRDHRRA